MIIKVHGSLGDQIMLTGLPKAYHKLFGEKSHIVGGRQEIWDGNPYITNKPIGETFSYTFNSYPKDYMVYYPIRLFYDMCGVIADRNFVHPAIYKKKKNSDFKLIVINDQAGWPSRVGYPFFDDLVYKLIEEFDIPVHYVRNERFRDCMGRCPAKEVKNSSTIMQEDVALSDLIDLINDAALYIGYNSGLSHIAGALNTPYIQFDGPIPPINTVHNSCIYVPNILACRRCVSEVCNEACLVNMSNINDEIIKVIKENDLF